MQLIVHRLAAALAVLGGLCLATVIVMTCLSIGGRALVPFGLAPIPGDFEIAEALVALAVFCFLPWCQLVAGHATVDLFTGQLGPGANRVIAAFWEVVAALTLVLIAWRLWHGFLGKWGNGETSMFLGFPTWWPYLACLVAAWAGVLVGAWTAWSRVRSVMQAHPGRQAGQDRP